MHFSSLEDAVGDHELLVRGPEIRPNFGRFSEMVGRLIDDC